MNEAGGYFAQAGAYATEASNHMLAAAQAEASVNGKCPDIVKGIGSLARNAANSFRPSGKYNTEGLFNPHRIMGPQSDLEAGLHNLAHITGDAVPRAVVFRDEIVAGLAGCDDHLEHAFRVMPSQDEAEELVGVLERAKEVAVSIAAKLQLVHGEIETLVSDTAAIGSEATVQSQQLM